MTNRRSGITSGEADYYEAGRWDASHAFSPRDVDVEVKLAPYLRRINQGGNVEAISREVYDAWAAAAIGVDYYAHWFSQLDKKDLARARIGAEKAYEQWQKGYRSHARPVLERYLKNRAGEFHDQEDGMRGNPTSRMFLVGQDREGDTYAVEVDGPPKNAEALADQLDELQESMQLDKRGTYRAWYVMADDPGWARLEKKRTSPFTFTYPFPKRANPRRRNAAGGPGTFMVLRIDRDNSDTYAKEMFPGLSDDDAIDDTLELANPDQGSIVEWGTVQARDPGAARLMRPPAGWQRVTAKQLAYWRVRQHAPLIREGMARALWVTSYANWVEDLPKRARAELGFGSLAQVDWDDVTPGNPETADEAAMAMYESFEMRNDAKMGDLLERAMQADGIPGTEEDYAEKFGHYLAMQTLGEGVSWFDDHAEFPLKFPDFEAWTDDGKTLDWSPRRNPKSTELTPDTLALFLKLARSAGSWSGQPRIDITKEQRGNLTALKRAKLLTTFDSDGDQFASFTPAGVALAAAHGLDVTP